MPDLTALVERVESGSGEDAELDGMIFDAMSSGDLGSAREVVLDRRKRPNWLPRYTSSLDAAVSLLEHMLPRKTPDILREALTALGRKHHWHICFPKPGQMDELPRFVVATLLRALQSKDDPHE